MTAANPTFKEPTDPVPQCMKTAQKSNHGNIASPATTSTATLTTEVGAWR